MMRMIKDSFQFLFHPVSNVINIQGEETDFKTFSIKGKRERNKWWLNKRKNQKQKERKKDIIHTTIVTFNELVTEKLRYYL